MDHYEVQMNVALSVVDDSGHDTEGDDEWFEITHTMPFVPFVGLDVAVDRSDDNFHFTITEVVYDMISGGLIVYGELLYNEELAAVRRLSFLKAGWRSTDDALSVE